MESKMEMDVFVNQSSDIKPEVFFQQRTKDGFEGYKTGTHSFGKRKRGI